MEASPYSAERNDGSEFSLREWAVKAQTNGEKSKSRRYSASYIRSFKEETRSFRSSNITFSSAASSPAYPFKDGIDPSTYSFNTALRALQARSCYNSWECLSPDGFALNSKWNEAEKYICNPLSGEVPLECLSSKALSGRSFRKSTNKVITVSDDPIFYPSRNPQTKTSTYIHEEDDEALRFPIPERKKEGMTRDVGIQSTPADLSSSSPSPTSTPSITERSIKEVGDSPNSNAKAKSEEERVDAGIVGAERSLDRSNMVETDKLNNHNIHKSMSKVEEKDKEREREKKQELWKKEEQLCRQGGCFPWIRKNRLKEKGRHVKIDIFITRCQKKEAARC